MFRKMLIFLATGYVMYWGFNYLTKNGMVRSHDQSRLAPHHLINIERRAHWPVREWHSRNNGNMYNFWSYAPDPWFSATPLTEFKFLHQGRLVDAKAQIFSINKFYDNEEFRERVFVLEYDGRTSEFPESGFRYLSWAASFPAIFVGQSNSTLYFVYKADALNLGLTKFEDAIFSINIEDVSRPVEHTLITDTEAWAKMINHVRASKLFSPGLDELCNVRMQDIAQTIYGEAC